MIFGVLILALAAGIAFYHYVQGLFSAMVSATLVILAALLAVSYHETVAESLFATTFPTYAHAVALVGLFALSYVLMRLISDRVVPGNVRVPVLVDKIGAGVFGFIAGIFATGILAIAAQLLPIGPDIAGYSRFALDDREVTGVRVKGRYQMVDVEVASEMKNDAIQPSQASSLFPLAADSLTLGLVSYTSKGGSLAGERPFDSVHPSYLDELFGHRLGPAYGADVLIGKQATPGVSAETVYSSDSVLNKREDFELPVVRGGRTPEVTFPDGAIPVVVRATIEPPSASGLNSFNTASIRLVVDGRNYFPIGVFQKGQVLLLTRPDDYLFVDGRNPVDFVFMVESELLPVKEGTDQRTMPPGSFIQAKRAGRADLGGMSIGTGIPSGSDSVGIVEKDKNSQQR